ncbi:BA14K family protein [Afipia sp. TerB]
MMNFKQGSAIALLALSLPFAASVANAMPVASSLTGQSASNDVTQVRWRSVPTIGGGGWHRGGGWHGGWHGGYYRRGWGGAGVGLGVASGLLLGSAIAAGSSPYYYGPGPGYYAAPAPAYDDSVTYCMNRFKSYDPASGTYLGYDGLRHPCP